MFEQTFVQAGAVVRRPWTMAASLTIQTGMVGILVLLPLIYTEQLPFRRLAEIFTAPTPPAPKAPPLKAVELVRVEAAIRGQMLAPHKLLDPGRFIPAKPAIIIDKEPPAMAVTAIGGGDRTGVVGGTGDDVQGILTGVLKGAAPPPQQAAAAAPKKEAVAQAIPRIRLGGEVQAAKLLSKPIPLYPTLARQARISGVVRLEAVIGIDGHVRELRAVSGHALLIPAALDAVKRWLYSPTLLNGDPVEVSTTIDVTFNLSN